jgi:molybdenum cofactor cytidylyltransferase
VVETIAEARRLGLIDSALVVHAPGAEAVREAAVRAGLDAVVAAGADRGFSESLRAGFAALPEGEAALVVLGDQPAIRLETMGRLIDAARPLPLSRALVRPRYRSDPAQPGHPVLVGREYWPLATEASGDRGLDPVLVARGLSWTTVEVAGANPDIDTPRDLADLPPDDSA